MDSRASEIKIPVPWGQVCGKWWGPREKQPILALHGWQDNAGTFDKLIPLFPDDIAVLCIDLPGHGLSSHYPKGQQYYIFWDGLVVVRRVVKHFKWQNISIIGHSLGGAIGFLYASIFPDDIEKLVSIDIVSPAVREPSRIVEELGQGIDRFLKYETLTPEQAPCYDYDEMLGIVQAAYKDSLTRESCEVLMKRGMSPVTKLNCNSSEDRYLFSRDVRLKVAGLGLISVDLVFELAERIKCEYLNIRAKSGLKFDKPEHYNDVLEKIKKTAKRFEFYEVEGTHHLHLNTPERISTHIVDFLTS